MRGPKPRPKPTPGEPPKLPAPKDLCPEAKAEWKRIVGLLSTQRVLSELDIAALTIYATSYATYKKAEAHVAEHGSVVLSSTGVPTKNPYMTCMKECWDRIRPLLAEFGLTPSSTFEQD